MSCKLLLLTLCIAAVALRADTVFVDNRAGSDANDGKSAAAAVKTLARALRLLVPGGKLVIQPGSGPYYESLPLRGDLGKDGRSLEVEGNGAVISGLLPIAPGEFEKRDGVLVWKTKRRPSNVRVKLFRNLKPMSEREDGGALQPGEFRWTGDSLQFLPAANDTDLASGSWHASLRDSGVAMLHAANITVKNLVAEHFSNDGFNFHGDCHNIRMENITGRNNGDDGFSAHEDCQVTVVGGEFFGNTYGIEDANASHTSFYNVKIHHNKTGVHFSGGRHLLQNCELTDNGVPLQLDRGSASSYLGKDRTASIFRAECFFKNGTIRGGQTGVKVNRDCMLAMIQSHIEGVPVGIEAGPLAELFLLGSIIDCPLPLKLDKAVLKGDRNCIHPDRIEFNGKIISLEELRKLTGGNAESFSARPVMTDGSSTLQPFLKEKPPLFLGPRRK